MEEQFYFIAVLVNSRVVVIVSHISGASKYNALSLITLLIYNSNRPTLFRICSVRQMAQVEKYQTTGQTSGFNLEQQRDVDFSSCLTVQIGYRVQSASFKINTRTYLGIKTRAGLAIISLFRRIALLAYLSFTFTIKNVDLDAYGSKAWLYIILGQIRAATIQELPYNCFINTM